MPITQSSYTSNTQADGSLSVSVSLFDQDAREYGPTTFPAPAGFNIPAKVSLMIAEMDEQLAQDKFRSLVGL